MLFLARPGPITATVLAIPTPMNHSFETYLAFAVEDSAGNTALKSQNLGIRTDVAVGKSVATAPIPSQPGALIIVYVHVASGSAVFGAEIMTGWPGDINFICCDGQPKVPAQISFGDNDTAVVTLGGASQQLPDVWATNPLRIQLTNVTGHSP